jgi:PAS domain S-box-containing protein
LKPKQDCYRLPIEHLPDAFAYHQIISDDHGNPVDFIFLEINSNFEDMTGLKRKDILGEKVTEVLPGIETTEFDWIGIYGQVALSGKANRFESFSEPLGRWYDVSVYSDKPGYFGVFFQDISDRKETEQAQQERELRFQRMLKVIPDMVSVHDPNMNIVYSNWIGFAAVPPEKQVLNSKCYKTYRDYDQICPDCQAVAVLESKEAFQAEAELSKGYWIDLRVIPLLDSRGEVEYFIEWVRDISDLKKIEEELRLFNIGLEGKVKERTAQLEASNRELDAFSYSVSHDLRGPLNRIKGFSQALLEDYSEQLDQQGQDYLRRIGNSSQLMAELIDDLLKLSKVTQMEICREPIELSALVGVCLKELQAKEPQRNIEISVTPGLVVEGDTALLRIVLENLIDNAWKFTRQKEVAQIEFGLNEQASQSAYYIRDNGAGFDMKHADKLFTAFQRLHSEQEFSGTGIGLSIVSRIIARHGGEVWAEGEPGKGACFYFTLP